MKSSSDILAALITFMELLGLGLLVILGNANGLLLIAITGWFFNPFVIATAFVTEAREEIIAKMKRAHTFKHYFAIIFNNSLLITCSYQLFIHDWLLTSVLYIITSFISINFVIAKFTK